MPRTCYPDIDPSAAAFMLRTGLPPVIVRSQEFDRQRHVTESLRRIHIIEYLSPELNAGTKGQTIS